MRNGNQRESSFTLLTNVIWETMKEYEQKNDHIIEIVLCLGSAVIFFGVAKLYPNSTPSHCQIFTDKIYTGVGKSFAKCDKVTLQLN
jgi:hypothetical protein